MEFSRQEYWSGLPCPAPGDLPNTGIEPESGLSPALAGGYFTTSATQGSSTPALYKKLYSAFCLCRFAFSGLFIEMKLYVKSSLDLSFDLECF